MSSVARSPKSRLAYIDNLRIFLTTLVICHHAAIGLGGPGLWYYVVAQDEGPITTVLLAMFVAVNQAFFMSLFFAVSAYFTPVSYDKRGQRAFLLDRLKRLGIPLAVFYFAINPAIVYLARFLQGEPRPSSYWATCGTGPLWFVLTLLLFSIAYVVIRTLKPAVARPRRLPSNRLVFAFALLAGIAAFLVRLKFPIGATVLNLQLGFFPLYVSMFVIGVWAARNGWFDELGQQQANLWYVVAMILVGLFPAIMAAMQSSGALDEGLDVVNGGAHWQALIYAMWEPLVCVGISMKLIVLFRERMNVSNATTKWMSASAYTVYIIHPFFVIAATWLVTTIPLPTLAKLVVAAITTVASCFSVANQVRKIPPLPRIV